jgi:IS1 family transposase
MQCASHGILPDDKKTIVKIKCKSNERVELIVRDRLTELQKLLLAIMHSTYHMQTMQRFA